MISEPIATSVSHSSLIQIVIEHKKQLHNPCIVLSLTLFWAVTFYVSHTAAIQVLPQIPRPLHCLQARRYNGKKEASKAISNRSCFVASHLNLDQSSSRNAKASINKRSVYRTITQSKTKTTKTKATPLGACEVIATSLWPNHDTLNAKTRR